MIETNYKVSVITVAYNSVSTIEKTIQSVVHQTYKNIEYIVIDGGSIDGTQQVIERYLNHISYYISEKDNGLYYAMNKGISKATGDIIGIINSDDWYVEDAIEAVVECFSKYDIELVYGKIVTVLEKNKEQVFHKVPLENMWFQMVIPHPSVFVKKDIYDRFGMFNINYSLSSDYELILRFYSKNVKFWYLDKIIAYFRSGGISTKKRMLSYEEGYRISMLYIDRCPNKDSILTKIKEIYNQVYFEEKIMNDPFIWSKLLNDYFHTNIQDIIIFGTGIWGQKCYEIFIKTYIAISYYVDNDSSKWNTKIHNIKVIAPSELKNIVGYVFVAVNKYEEQIKQQLENISNNKLRIVCLNEIKKLSYIV